MKTVRDTTGATLCSLAHWLELVDCRRMGLKVLAMGTSRHVYARDLRTLEAVDVVLTERLRDAYRLGNSGSGIVRWREVVRSLYRTAPEGPPTSPGGEEVA